MDAQCAARAISDILHTGICEQVFRTFEEHLQRGGLRYAQTRVTTAAGYSGLGNNEDVYDGGYAMYFIEHEQEPSACWGCDMSDLEFGKPLFPASS